MTHSSVATRPLGSKGLLASSIGLGCMGMSDMYGTSATRDDVESIATIQAAADAGVSFIDTGDFYGTDVLDIYQPARVDPAVPIEETVGAIADLISEGKVRYLGVSELTAEQLERAHRAHPVTALEIEYSLATRFIEADILPLARKLGIGINVNTRGTFFTLQHAAELVSDGGRIIVVCSNTTQLALPGFAVYGASKLAPKYFVEVLAKELGPRGITVNSISPGVTRSAGVFTTTPDEDPYLQQMIRATPLGRLGRPDDIANAVLLLTSPLASFITGHHLDSDGGAAL